MDIGILLTHEKPLGIRLIPIKGKLPNERTEFEMDFLTNTRILGLQNEYLSLNE